MSDLKTVQDFIQIFREHGDLSYEGEGVTQLNHAWQCGRLAEQSGAAPTLVLAAWLHDIGHLLNVQPMEKNTPTLLGIDDAHENLGAEILRPLFGDAVAESVKLHVAAKRYLVSTQTQYRQRLSEDSVRSLALQGGPFSPDECDVFMQQAFARDAVKLRVWDDLAKQSDLVIHNKTEALRDLEQLMTHCLV
jgi:phosphonate degradation associated HDIG domain protein